MTTSSRDGARYHHLRARPQFTTAMKASRRFLSGPRWALGRAQREREAGRRTCLYTCPQLFPCTVCTLRQLLLRQLLLLLLLMVHLVCFHAKKKKAGYID